MHNFFSGKSILLTGHTGFKGAWFSELLLFFGAKLSGFALDPEKHSLFFHLGLSERMNDIRGDICNLALLQQTIQETQPQLVIHFAAQSLISVGRADPIGTFSTNIMGTVHLLDSIRMFANVPVLVVTSDKCYVANENPRRVGDILGGSDPYSASKAAVEMVVQAYRGSFGMNIATARAGNAIGGGDWGKNRLIPDVMRAKYYGKSMTIRHPLARRPWQHVLDLSRGYAMLAAQLLQGKGFRAWNFGPEQSITVKQVLAEMGVGSSVVYEQNPPTENLCLRLEGEETALLLGWRNRLDWKQAIQWTVEDYQLLYDNPSQIGQRIQQRIQQLYS